MIRAGIIGATGYAGAELVRLLTGHPQVEIEWLVSKSYIGQAFSSIYGNMFDIIDTDCVGDDLSTLSDSVDVIFTATPQGYLSGKLNSDILEKVKVVDLSADYRLSDVDTYEKWYGLKHGSPELLKESVYGLCEIHREDIRTTRLVANPGCYTTCSIMSLYPLVKDKLIDASTIIIDAKSGTSGAGRSSKTDNLFCEVNENCKAYGVATHRHTPEIEEQLSLASDTTVVLNFTPHLIPMNRGILITAYASLSSGAGREDIEKAYSSYYKDERFVRLLPYGTCPQTKWTEGSNYIDIGFVCDERTQRVIVMGALDNLIKGAAGQAVQNMNIVFGIDESCGLEAVPVFP